LAKVEGDFVANAFFVNSVARTADAGEVLGDTAAATEYRRLAAELATVTWDRWRDHALTSQTGCALAVVFDLAPSHDLPAVAGRLAELVRAADGAVSTGFLGTPLVLPALARFDHFDEAYLMLLRTEVRSWLYQVLMGGTTTWERWDAIRPDGTIHDGAILPHDPDAGDPTDHHMLSFNHYGYGAVVDWVVRHTGGIAPVISHPGYQRVRCAPRPPAALTSAAVAVDTDLGPLSLTWQIGSGGDLEVDVEVPFGVVADLDLPVTPDSTVSIDGRTCHASTTLTAGRTRVTVTRPRRYGPERTDQ
jgi:alpha-L-rhamnosidase